MKTFEVMYQAAGAKTGLTVQMDVYKPDKTLDATQSEAMAEIGTTGRYYKSFDADVPNWSIQCSDSKDDATKLFDEAAFEAHGITLLVADVETAVVAVAASIATLSGIVSGIDTKADDILTGVGDLSAGITALASALALIEGKIDDLGSPASIG